MNTLNSNSIIHLLFLCLPVLFLSCENEDDSMEPGYEIPETYNFENVNYSGQQQRLAMLLEMKNYMATARSSGTVLDANKLKAMYANDAANAGWEQTYGESKQLKSKTFEQEQAVFDALLEELAEASQSTQAGASGQAGVVESQDGSKKYLLGTDGLDHAQLIEKGLMGACFYYQATSVYLGEDRMNVDNDIVEPGEGTEMEHHWDEAFGYFGVPKDFPITTEGAVFWGDYSVKRDEQLNCNQPAMDALLKGRAAISNKDMETRDEAIMDVRDIWEQIVVASAIHYLNVSIENFDDMAILGHGLTEGIGFVYGLKFNEEKTITNEQIDELLVLMAGSSEFDKMDLYSVIIEDLESAKDKLVGYYGMEDIADEL